MPVLMIKGAICEHCFARGKSVGHYYMWLRVMMCVGLAQRWRFFEEKKLVENLKGIALLLQPFDGAGQSIEEFVLTLE